VRTQGGAVTVVQRTNADLRANPHFHTIALDGVFAAGDGHPTPVFHPLDRLDASDVRDLLAVVRTRILRFLVGQGVVDGDETLTVLPGDIAEREPALATLAAASVAGLPPAGPERRAGMQPVSLRTESRVELTAPLTATCSGFSLHAATTAAGSDQRGREALLRYVLRPPIAQDRLERLPDGLVRIHLRRPFADGTVAVDLDPLSLLSRLCAAIPPPRFHTVRYAGVLAAASSWRSRIVPPPPDNEPDNDTHATATPPKNPRPATHRSIWRPWHELLRRSFDVDREACPACGGRMRLKGIYKEADSVQRILRHLGEPFDDPPRAPATDPPTYQSRVLRRRSRDLA